MKGRIFFLTDAWCGSSCLVFADLILGFPNVTQVGSPTHADRGNGNLRVAELSPKETVLAFATTVIRNGPRGDNQPYIPQHRFPGEISDTPSLERWITELAKPQR